MNTSQQFLPLPKIYRPPLVLRIVWLFLGILIVPIAMAAVSTLSVGLVTGQLLQDVPLSAIAIIVCLIMPLGILVLCMHILNFSRLCLKFTQEGIFFFSVGQRFFTPWSNVASFRRQNNLRLVEMQQAAEEISLEEGVRRNVAAQEVAWWLRWAVDRPASSFLLPQEFGEELWNSGEIERYLQQYTPHL